MRACLLGCLATSLIVTVPLSAAEIDKSTAKSYQIPYRLLDTKHIMVRVKVNGKGPFNLILDTGSPALFISTAAGKKAGATKDKDGWSTFKRLELEGGLVIPDARGRVEDPFQLQGMNGLGLAGVELHGMLGYNILARYRIEIDLTKNKMTWTPLDFKPPPPVGLRGKHGEPAELNAMGAVMKVLGVLMGKKAAPDLTFRGFMGIELMQGKGQAEVKRVLKDSPAGRAGLKAGDHITAFQSHSVSSAADLAKWSAHVTAGKTVVLTVTRDGAQRELSLKTGEGL